MSDFKIKASRRDDAGKGASRRLRRQGLVPAILYGNNRPPINIQLEQNELIHASRREGFFSSVFDLDFNGKTRPVLVRDWQVHPYKQQLLHMDFMRVDEDAEITMNVPLRFLNQEESPAGKAANVVISHNLVEVEVACLSKDLPPHIDVDLSKLEEGDVIHLTDLVLPEGVELVVLRHDDEYDEPVTSAQFVREEPEEDLDDLVPEGEVPTTSDDDQAADADGDGSKGDGE